MQGYDDWLLIETQSERLGVLWRSQGQTFLDEQAAELQADVERLRVAYLAAVAPAAAPAPASVAIRPRRRLLPKPSPKTRVIDLRDTQPSELPANWVCSTDGHPLESAVAQCSRCEGIFCRRCILQAEATHGRALCLKCALVAAGVHHKKSRPLAYRAR
jgi:hypothetical protein